MFTSAVQAPTIASTVILAGAFVIYLIFHPKGK